MAASENTRAGGRVAFTYPSFVLCQLSRFFIVLAGEMQSVAVGWQVYEITKRPLDLGLVGLAQFLPCIFLFLVAGHAADRYDRRVLIVSCYSGYAICAGSLLYTGSILSTPSMRCSSCRVSCALSEDQWAALFCRNWSPKRTSSTPWPGTPASISAPSSSPPPWQASSRAH